MISISQTYLAVPNGSTSTSKFIIRFQSWWITLTLSNTTSSMEIVIESLQRWLMKMFQLMAMTLTLASFVF
jgi:hypothetical protein